MGHLIPLVLGAASDQTQTNSRPISTSSPTVLLPILPSSPSLADPYPVEPMVPEALPTKTQERLITPPRPNPVTDLIIMPYTQQEWQKVMDEVRLLYLRRQYKHCSTRCSQILDGIEDPYRVHPLYSVYLCFYAATCLEMIARSLHANSSEKIPLLQSSLDYYGQAELYMEYATFSADPAIISSVRESNAHLQSTSSSVSSQRSSIDSIFSVISSASSTTENSPVSPAFSVEPAEKDAVVIHTPTPILVRPRPLSESELKPAPLKLKKKVSFSLPADVSPKTLLGTPARVVSSPACLPSKPSISSPPRSATPSQSQPLVALAATPPEYNPSSITSYLLSRSVTNYRTHLSDFSTQLAYHQSTVTSMITQIQSARKARRSNTPEIFTDFTNRIMDFAEGCLEGGGTGGVDSEERKRKELEERRRRLRDSGWRRQRFSGEKYEKLCEIALSELEESGYPQAI